MTDKMSDSFENHDSNVFTVFISVPLPLIIYILGHRFSEITNYKYLV